MRNLVLFLIVILLFPYIVLSQEATPVYAGELVPFDGLLISEDRFVKFLESEAREDLLEKELEFKDYEVKLEQEFCDKKVDVCLEELNKCREIAETPWYARPDINRWLGIGIGVAITSLAVYGAGQLDGR